MGYASKYAKELLAVAFAEMRSMRRLVRTWLFATLSLVIGLGLYVFLSVSHGLTSSASASLGIQNPRFIMASQGAIVVYIFVVAMIFLAFDIRAKDARERIVDALDVRPVGNLTLLTGRMIGVVFITWLVILLLVLCCQGIGALALAMDWPFGELIEPRSVLVLLFVDALPVLAMWCSLTILLAVTVRNRLAVVVLALGLVAGWSWAIYQVPVYLQPAVSMLLSATTIPSDVVPLSVPPFHLAQQGCVLLLTAGFLALAAALHPRPDRRRRLRLTSGTVLVALGCVGIALLLWKLGDDKAQQRSWLAAHQARQDDPRPLLESVVGKIVIAPGDELTLTLDYTLTPRSGQSLLFSLNPGMSVTALRVEGVTANFTHDNGLLDIALPAPFANQSTANQSTLTVSLAATGVPLPAFGYLDSATDLTTQSANNTALVSLGDQASIFDESYVALMPGVFWMPLPGAAAGHDDPTRYGRDYFRIDIAVDVPDNWLVAGPGRREGYEEKDGRFRFRPSAPVPEVALLAAPFERSAMQVAGVELELLTSAAHPRNKALFADAAPQLEERLTELFASAEKMGLGYPYGGLSLVEVPVTLRTFGGGWRMDSVQALPGVLMLRETGWPTSRFNHLFRHPEAFENDEGGIGAAKLRVLERFFENDVTGGNPLHGVVRNFVGFQTSARGDGAIALDFVLHELATQLLSDAGSGFFSPFAFSSEQRISTLVARTVISMKDGSSATIGSSVYSGLTNTPSVWGRALNTSLADIDPAEGAERALNVLWLKAPKIASVMLDGLGRENVAALLAEVRRRHAGNNFTAQDFATAGAAVGVDLDALLGDWLHDATLPGFLVSPVRIDRLDDDDQGQPRYQIGVHIRNDEPVPGMVRLSYASFAKDTRPVFDATPPVRVAGNTSVELGLVASRLPERLNLALYLSLNRDQFLFLPIPEVDEAQTTASEPFTGWRPSTWMPNLDSSIVVDDLDPGFSVVYANTKADLRLGGSQADGTAPSIDIDQGLPVYSPMVPVGGWSRDSIPASWGKYRHTVARAAPGDGNAKAVFTAQLPASGRWRLDYHLPELRHTNVTVDIGTSVKTKVRRRAYWRHGSYNLRIASASGETTVEFDGAAAEPGWNLIGEYDQPAGEVRVVVSNQTSGRYCVADAIRWRQVQTP